MLNDLDLLLDEDDDGLLLVVDEDGSLLVDDDYFLHERCPLAEESFTLKRLPLSNRIDIRTLESPCNRLSRT